MVGSRRSTASTALRTRSGSSVNGSIPEARWVCLRQSAYDFQWIDFYVWRYFGENPFLASRSIGVQIVYRLD